MRYVSYIFLIFLFPPPFPAVAAGQECVVLLHGLARSDGSMEEMAERRKQVESGEWCESREPILRDYVAGIKARHVQRVVDRFETEPGRQAQVDWGSTRVWIGARALRVHLFVMVLSYSRHLFVQFYHDQAMANFLRGHEAAFRAWGGLPRHYVANAHFEKSVS